MKFYLKVSNQKSKESGKESNLTAPTPHLIMGKLYDKQFADGRFVYSTGERILPAQWSKDGKPKKGNEALQIRLNKISSAAATYITNHREDLTKEGLKAHLDDLRPKEKKRGNEGQVLPKTLVELWAEYLASIKDTIEWRTFNSYSNSFETTSGHSQEKGPSKKKRKGVNFREFLTEKMWEGITPEQFTITHYNLYNGYLKKNVKPNTAAKRLKHLKQFFTHVSIDLKIPIGFDLNKISYRETSGLKLSLSESELQAYIDAADLPEHLVKIRDLAVLQCSTGLRISDRKRIDKNIRGNKIVIEAQKTRSKMEIPITTQARVILEKYDYELPKISEQKYRAGIKEIHKKLFPNQTVQVREGSGYKDVFVWEEISSHDMVRTFITLSHERGMSVSSIAQITGKTVKVLLSNYLVESQKVAEQEMEKAWGASPLKVAR